MKKYLFRNRKKEAIPEKILKSIFLPTEISLADARKIKPNCQIDDIVTVEVKSEEFSRRAAKNAKGTIVQKIREEEKAALYNEYHSKEKKHHRNCTKN